MDDIHNPNPNLSIVLVDDDAAFVEDMRQALTRCLSGRRDGWVYTAFPDAKAFWRGYEAERPDIVFIDVMLPGENGIEIAEKLHSMDVRPILVFVSSSADFAVHGYGVNALRYLLKPVTDTALDNVLEACRKRLCTRRDDILPIRGRGGSRRIPLADITHLESSNRQVLVHLEGETATCSGKLADYLPLLSERFLQVHKSFIVNLDHAAWLRSGEITLDNGQKVPVSRRYRDLAVERFFNGLTRGAGN